MVFDQTGKYQDLLEVISETYRQSPFDPEYDPILNIQSSSGESYYLSFTAGQCSVNWGKHPRATVTYKGPIDTFIDILRKKTDPLKSILDCLIDVEGDIAFFLHLRNSFSLVDTNRKEKRFDKTSPVFRGPLGLSGRSVFSTMMFSGFLLQVMQLMHLGRNFIILPASLFTLLLGYLFFTDKVHFRELLLFLIYPAFTIALYYNYLGVSGNIFFLYNIYMIIIFTGSFFFERTIVGRYNSININNREYTDCIINNHQSNITILWILLFCAGVAISMVPWSRDIYQILAGNLYLLLFVLTGVYSFLELGSC
ncbi:SCP2 sterol-binding domain-containing protein [Spirochaeta isovalerica]|uniref:Putative sterol carrier protein n=1 Tax=Spirochaeta isovalerica TaxID=150 RepID=A0A841R9C6_9SPIO|nr:SCP2 sterol-binding domain-containing protein [Spirochaeta isovalerica]MBB6480503.1 putative sterol carrier protein [Spirochaeta isovalerica]